MMFKTYLSVLDEDNEWKFVEYYLDPESIVGVWLTQDSELNAECYNLHLSGGHTITVRSTKQLQDYIKAKI